MTELPRKFSHVVEDDAGRRALLRLDLDAGTGEVFTDLDRANQPRPTATPVRTLGPTEVARTAELVRRLEQAGETYGDQAETAEGDRLTGTHPAVPQALTELVTYVLGPHA